MFKTGLKESIEGVGLFPDDNPAAFGALIQWVYQDRVEVPQYVVCAKTSKYSCSGENLSISLEESGSVDTEESNGISDKDDTKDHVIIPEVERDEYGFRIPPNKDDRLADCQVEH